MRGSSFSIQIIRRTLLIMLLCIFLLIIIFLLNTLQSSRRESKNSYIQMLQSHQSKLDYSISFTTKSLNQLTNEQTFIEYCMSTDSINYHMINVRKSLISKLSLFDNSCYSVGIIKSNSPIVLTQSSSFSVEDYFDDIHIDSSRYEAVREKLENAANGTYYVLPPREDNPTYITLAAKYEIMSDITVYVLTTYYKEKFLPEIYGSERFFMLAGSDIVLESPKTQSEKESIDLNIIKMAEKSEPVPRSIALVNKKNNYYISAPSGTFIGRYVIVVPSNTRSIVLSCILWVCMLFLIAWIVLSIINTKKYISPIGDIAKKLQPFYKNETEDNNELSFISGAMNEIIQTNQSLIENINTKNQDLKNKFIIELLLGVLSDEDIYLGLSQHNINYSGRHIFVVIIDFFDFEVAGNTAISTNDLIEQVNLFLPKHRYGGALAELIMFKSKYVALFSDIPAYTLTKFLEHLISELNRFYNVKMVAAIGSLASSPEILKDSFNTALGLLEYKHALSYKRVLTAKSLTALDNCNIYYPLDIEHALINYTIYGKKNKVHYILNDIFKANFKNSTIDSEMFSEFVQAITYTVKRCLQLTDTSLSDVFEDGTILYLELKMCKTAAELSEKTFYIFDKIIGHITALSAKAAILTPESFSAYIAENYSRDISLSDIADFFGFSQPYMSKMIKSLTNTNFKKYLNNYRIEMAKQMLLNDDLLKIYEIAEKVGFSNQNSFIRAFSAITGMTPAEYRKQNKL